MSKQQDTIALKLYETFNRREWQALSEFVDPSCTVRDMGTGTEWKGVDGMKQWLQKWATLSSDLKVDDVQAVASSDTMVCIEGKGRGRNDGPIQSPQGTLPASGKPVTVEWVDLVTVKQGKIAGIRCYYDTGRLMAQLGIGGQAPSRGQTTGVQH